MLYMVSYLFIMRLRSLGFRSCFFSLLPSLLCIDFLIMCSLLYYEQPIYSYSYLSADIVFSFSSPIWNTSICFVVIPCRREWCQLYLSSIVVNLSNSISQFLIHLETAEYEKYLQCPRVCWHQRFWYLCCYEGLRVASKTCYASSRCGDLSEFTERSILILSFFIIIAVL